jgi:hypothetical protein
VATAWEDISLFQLMISMLQLATQVYQHATSFFTCSGDGVPIATANELVREWTASALGIPSRNIAPSMPGWEVARQKALQAEGLPPIPWRCYGSQWIHLVRADAMELVRLSSLHISKLTRAYRSAYAHGPAHGGGHALLHPDEEFAAYVLYVLGDRAWPTAADKARCVMWERSERERKCTACAYHVAHAARVGVGKAEERARESARYAGAAFMRKVV